MKNTNKRNRFAIKIAAMLAAVTAMTAMASIRRFGSRYQPLRNDSERQIQDRFGTYKLDNDLTTDGSIVTQEGSDVVIGLNGHTIDRALTMRTSCGSAIAAGKNSKLTIIDSNPNGGGILHDMAHGDMDYSGNTYLTLKGKLYLR